MFTGIVEELGTVESIEEQPDAVRLTVRATAVLQDARAGDSISVNGCCLTVADRGEGAFTADVMRETLDKTALGQLEPGARVNLERAATPTTRLGGHLVQGHIDGTGTITSRVLSEHWELVEIAMPAGLGRYVVSKGSICVDGVSLTVVSTSSTSGNQRSTRGNQRATSGNQRASFTVSLIPETLARTTLGLKQPGDAVNLEVDVIAKYVEALLPPKDGA